jgi:hypothetical protein
MKEQKYPEDQEKDNLARIVHEFFLISVSTASVQLLEHLLRVHQQLNATCVDEIFQLLLIVTPKRCHRGAAGGESGDKNESQRTTEEMKIAERESK